MAAKQIFFRQTTRFDGWTLSVFPSDTPAVRDVLHRASGADHTTLPPDEAARVASHCRQAGGMAIVLPALSRDELAAALTGIDLSMVPPATVQILYAQLYRRHGPIRAPGSSWLTGPHTPDMMAPWITTDGQINRALLDINSKYWADPITRIKNTPGFHAHMYYIDGALNTEDFLYIHSRSSNILYAVPNFGGAAFGADVPQVSVIDPTNTTAGAWTWFDPLFYLTTTAPTPIGFTTAFVDKDSPVQGSELTSLSLMGYLDGSYPTAAHLDNVLADASGLMHLLAVASFRSISFVCPSIEKRINCRELAESTNCIIMDHPHGRTPSPFYDTLMSSMIGSIACWVRDPRSVIIIGHGIPMVMGRDYSVVRLDRDPAWTTLYAIKPACVIFVNPDQTALQTASNFAAFEVHTLTVDQTRLDLFRDEVVVDDATLLLPHYGTAVRPATNHPGAIVINHGSTNLALRYLGSLHGVRHHIRLDGWSGSLTTVTARPNPLVIPVLTMADSSLPTITTKSVRVDYEVLRILVMRYLGGTTSHTALAEHAAALMSVRWQNANVNTPYTYLSQSEILDHVYIAQMFGYRHAAGSLLGTVDAPLVDHVIGSAIQTAVGSLGHMFPNARRPGTDPTLLSLVKSLTTSSVWLAEATTETAGPMVMSLPLITLPPPPVAPTNPDTYDPTAALQRVAANTPSHPLSPPGPAQPHPRPSNPPDSFGGGLEEHHSAAGRPIATAPPTPDAVTHPGPARRKGPRPAGADASGTVPRADPLASPSTALTTLVEPCSPIVKTATRNDQVKNLLMGLTRDSPVMLNWLQGGADHAPVPGKPFRVAFTDHPVSGLFPRARPPRITRESDFKNTEVDSCGFEILHYLEPTLTLGTMRRITTAAPPFSLDHLRTMASPENLCINLVFILDAGVEVCLNDPSNNEYALVRLPGTNPNQSTHFTLVEVSGPLTTPSIDHDPATRPPGVWLPWNESRSLEYATLLHHEAIAAAMVSVAELVYDDHRHILYNADQHCPTFGQVRVTGVDPTLTPAVTALSRGWRSARDSAARMLKVDAPSAPPHDGRSVWTIAAGLALNNLLTCTEAMDSREVPTACTRLVCDRLHWNNYTRLLMNAGDVRHSDVVFLVDNGAVSTQHVIKLGGRVYVDCRVPHNAALYLHDYSLFSSVNRFARVVRAVPDPNRALNTFRQARGWVGPPGSGKTYNLVRNAGAGPVLGVALTSAGAARLRASMASAGVSGTAMTLEQYIRGEDEPTTLLIDEATMFTWLDIPYLWRSSIQSVLLAGDTTQIGHRDFSDVAGDRNALDLIGLTSNVTTLNQVRRFGGPLFELYRRFSPNVTVSPDAPATSFTFHNCQQADPYRVCVDLDANERRAHPNWTRAILTLHHKDAARLHANDTNVSTVHSFQGNEVDVVIVHWDCNSDLASDTSYLVSALTRARRVCHWVCTNCADAKTMDQMVQFISSTQSVFGKLPGPATKEDTVALYLEHLDKLTPPGVTATVDRDACTASFSKFGITWVTVSWKTDRFLCDPYSRSPVSARPYLNNPNWPATHAALLEYLSGGRTAGRFHASPGSELRTVALAEWCKAGHTCGLKWVPVGPKLYVKAYGGCSWNCALSFASDGEGALPVAHLSHREDHHRTLRVEKEGSRSAYIRWLLTTALQLRPEYDPDPDFWSALTQFNVTARGLLLWERTWLHAQAATRLAGPLCGKDFDTTRHQELLREYAMWSPKNTLVNVSLPEVPPDAYPAVFKVNGWTRFTDSYLVHPAPTSTEEYSYRPIGPVMSHRLRRLNTTAGRLFAAVANAIMPNVAGVYNDLRVPRVLSSLPADSLTKTQGYQQYTHKLQSYIKTVRTKFARPLVVSQDHDVMCPHVCPARIVPTSVNIVPDGDLQLSTYRALQLTQHLRLTVHNCSTMPHAGWRIGQYDLPYYNYNYNPEHDATFKLNGAEIERILATHADDVAHASVPAQMSRSVAVHGALQAAHRPPRPSELLFVGHSALTWSRHLHDEYLYLVPNQPSAIKTIRETQRVESAPHHDQAVTAFGLTLVNQEDPTCRVVAVLGYYTLMHRHPRITVHHCLPSCAALHDRITHFATTVEASNTFGEPGYVTIDGPLLESLDRRALMADADHAVLFRMAAAKINTMKYSRAEVAFLDTTSPECVVATVSLATYRLGLAKLNATLPTVLSTLRTPTVDKLLGALGLPPLVELLGSLPVPTALVDWFERVLGDLGNPATDPDGLNRRSLAAMLPAPYRRVRPAFTLVPPTHLSGWQRTGPHSPFLPPPGPRPDRRPPTGPPGSDEDSSDEWVTDDENPPDNNQPRHPTTRGSASTTRGPSRHAGRPYGSNGGRPTAATSTPAPNRTMGRTRAEPRSAEPQPPNRRRTGTAVGVIAELPGDVASPSSGTQPPLAACARSWVAAAGRPSRERAHKPTARPGAHTEPAGGPGHQVAPPAIQPQGSDGDDEPGLQPAEDTVRRRPPARARWSKWRKVPGSADHTRPPAPKPNHHHPTNNRFAILPTKRDSAAPNHADLSDPAKVLDNLGPIGTTATSVVSSVAAAFTKWSPPVRAGRWSSLMEAAASLTETTKPPASLAHAMAYGVISGHSNVVFDYVVFITGARGDAEPMWALAKNALASGCTVLPITNVYNARPWDGPAIVIHDSIIDNLAAAQGSGSLWNAATLHGVPSLMHATQQLLKIEKVRCQRVMYNYTCPLTTAAYNEMEAVQAIRVHTVPLFLMTKPVACRYGASVPAYDYFMRLMVNHPHQAEWCTIPKALYAAFPTMAHLNLGMQRHPPLIDARSRPRPHGKSVFVAFGSLQSVGNGTTARSSTISTLLRLGYAVTCLADGPEGTVVIPRYNPGDLAMFDLVVCHGGAGTIITALAAGTPVCVVPHFFDQDWWRVTSVCAGYGVNLEQLDGTVDQLVALHRAVVAMPLSFEPIPPPWTIDKDGDCGPYAITCVTVPVPMGMSIALHNATKMVASYDPETDRDCVRMCLQMLSTGDHVPPPTRALDSVNKMLHHFGWVSVNIAIVSETMTYCLRSNQHPRWVVLSVTGKPTSIKHCTIPQVDSQLITHLQSIQPMVRGTEFVERLVRAPTTLGVPVDQYTRIRVAGHPTPTPWLTTGDAPTPTHLVQTTTKVNEQLYMVTLDKPWEVGATAIATAGGVGYVVPTGEPTIVMLNTETMTIRPVQTRATVQIIHNAPSAPATYVRVGSTVRDAAAERAGWVGQGEFYGPPDVLTRLRGLPEPTLSTTATQAIVTLPSIVVINDQARHLDLILRPSDLTWWPSGMTAGALLMDTMFAGPGTGPHNQHHFLREIIARAPTLLVADTAHLQTDLTTHSESVESWQDETNMYLVNDDGYATRVVTMDTNDVTLMTWDRVVFADDDQDIDTLVPCNANDWPMTSNELPGPAGYVYKQLMTKYPDLSYPVNTRKSMAETRAFLAKNAAVQRLQTIAWEVDSELAGYFSTCLPGLRKVDPTPVHFDPKATRDWVLKHHNARRVNSDLHEYVNTGGLLSKVDNVTVSLKVESLTKESDLDTAACQTDVVPRVIVWQRYAIAACFAPVFRTLKDRWKAALDPRIRYCDGLRLDEIKAIVESLPNEDGWVIEDDLSKQDRQTTSQLIEVEMQTYRALGMPDELISWWRRCHGSWAFKGNFIRGYGSEQRLTGQASTALGNAIVNTVVHRQLAEELGHGLQLQLVLGDDYLAIARTLPNVERHEQRAKAKYNMVSKVKAPAQVGTFCTMLIGRTADGWTLTPDIRRMRRKFEVSHGTSVLTDANCRARAMSYLTTLGDHPLVRDVCQRLDLPIQPRSWYRMDVACAFAAYKYGVSIDDIVTDLHCLLRMMVGEPVLRTLFTTTWRPQQPPTPAI